MMETEAQKLKQLIDGDCIYDLEMTSISLVGRVLTIRLKRRGMFALIQYLNNNEFNSKFTEAFGCIIASTVIHINQNNNDDDRMVIF